MNMEAESSVVNSATAAVRAKSSASHDDNAMLVWVLQELFIKVPHRNTMNEVVLVRVTLHPAQF